MRAQRMDNLTISLHFDTIVQKIIPVQQFTARQHHLHRTKIVDSRSENRSILEYIYVTPFPQFLYPSNWKSFTGPERSATNVKKKKNSPAAQPGETLSKTLRFQFESIAARELPSRTCGASEFCAARRKRRKKNPQPKLQRTRNHGSYFSPGKIRFSTYPGSLGAPLAGAS